MPITKQKKAEIIEKLSAGLKTAETVVFVGFKQMKLSDQNAMRKALREKGITYYVAKKTLVRRALDAKGVKGTMPETPGEVAIVWSTDPVAPAKGVYEFAKKHKDSLTLFGGIYEGTYQTQAEIMVLATIPSREELYGKFVGMLSAVYGGFARAVEAKRKQMETAPAGA